MVGVDTGGSFGIEMTRRDPFDPASRAHAHDEASVGDQWMIERAHQAHVVDVGEPAVLPLVQVMDLRPLCRHVAAGPRAAAAVCGSNRRSPATAAAFSGVHSVITGTAGGAPPAPVGSGMLVPPLCRYPLRRNRRRNGSLSASR